MIQSLKGVVTHVADLRRVPSLGLATFLGMSLLPTAASAAVNLVLGASAGIEQNTNVLERNDSVPAIPALGTTDRGDVGTRLSATASLITGETGPLRTELQARYSRLNFAELDTFDYSDYRVSANTSWRIARLADLSLQASLGRAAIGIADIGGLQVPLQTTRQAEATFRIRPTPRWQVGVTPGWNEMEMPQPAAPSFLLRETSGAAFIDYLGAGRVVPGVLVRETSGRFTGIDNATRYTQTSASATVSYKVTEFSSFLFVGGYTERSTTLIDPADRQAAAFLEGSTPAVTGSLSYQRRLTAKTSIDLNAFRDFQQFAAGVNTTVGTGVGGTVTWTATPRVSATFGTRWIWSTIDDLQFSSTVNDRTDLLRLYSVDVTYRVTRRGSVHAYASRRARDSTSRFALFDATTVGVEVSATLD